MFANDPNYEDMADLHAVTTAQQDDEPFSPLAKAHNARKVARSKARVKKLRAKSQPAWFGLYFDPNHPDRRDEDDDYRPLKAIRQGAFVQLGLEEMAEIAAEEAGLQALLEEEDWYFYDVSGLDDTPEAEDGDESWEDGLAELDASYLAELDAMEAALDQGIGQLRFPG